MHQTAPPKKAPSRTYTRTRFHIQPGDVVLIAHRGQTTGADHIALVESFDGRKLVTLEGNASGTLPNGKTVRAGVVRKSRDLGDVQIRATLFGVGRISKLDYA